MGEQGIKERGRKRRRRWDRGRKGVSDVANCFATLVFILGEIISVIVGIVLHAPTPMVRQSFL